MNESLKKVKDFIVANGCDEEEFFNTLLCTLRLFVLEDICQKLKSDNKLKTRVKSEYRKTHNHQKASIKLVKEICGTELTDTDAIIINEWIIAFLKKRDQRDDVDDSLRKRLFFEQEGKCACCHNKISIENSHFDHIIPWDYVGDELSNNGQLLCSYCNEHKNNNVYYLLKRKLIKKNIKTTKGD